MRLNRAETSDRASPLLVYGLPVLILMSAAWTQQDTTPAHPDTGTSAVTGLTLDLDAFRDQALRNDAEREGAHQEPPSDWLDYERPSLDRHSGRWELQRRDQMEQQFWQPENRGLMRDDMDPTGVFRPYQP